jgi:hypothetical protein
MSQVNDLMVMRSVFLRSMPPKSILLAALGLSAAILSGCANHFVSSFRPVPNYAGSIPPQEAAPDPRLIVTADPKHEVDQLKEAGFVVMGTSGFDRDWKPRHLLREDAVREGRYLGAEVVVLRKAGIPVPVVSDPTVAAPGDATAQEFRYFAVYLKRGIQLAETRKSAVVAGGGW